MATITWKGAETDPSYVVQYGVTFPKGKAVDVPDDHKNMAKFVGNPHFEVEGLKEPKAPASKSDEEPLYEAVHKGRGVFAVIGPEGVPDEGPFTKPEAVARAAELNAAPSAQEV